MFCGMVEPEELRIIAKDCRLDDDDKEVIVAAAEELERAWAMVLSMQHDLIESNARRIAGNEALLALRSRMTVAPLARLHG